MNLIVLILCITIVVLLIATIVKGSNWTITAIKSGWVFIVQSYYFFTGGRDDEE